MPSIDIGGKHNISRESLRKICLITEHFHIKVRITMEGPSHHNGCVFIFAAGMAGRGYFDSETYDDMEVACGCQSKI